MDFLKIIILFQSTAITYSQKKEFQDLLNVQSRKKIWNVKFSMGRKIFLHLNVKN